MSLRLIRARSRAIVVLSSIAAFLLALVMANSPRLHASLHYVDRQHECAATLLASGSYENAGAPEAISTIENVPIAPAFAARDCILAIGASPSSILEHAPPIRSGASINRVS